MIAAVAFGVLSVFYWTGIALKATTNPGLDWHTKLVEAAIINALWGATVAIMSVVEKRETK